MMNNIMIKDVLLLVVAIGGCILIGAISGMTANSTEGYSNIEMPVGSPPGWVFPIVWFILYALMGLSLWMVYRAGNDYMFYILFAAQLILNFLWTPLFFGHGHMELAMVDLVAMWVIVLVMIYLTWSRGLEVAAYLLIPYIVWLTFAGYLNAGAIYLN